MKRLTALLLFMIMATLPLSALAEPIVQAAPIAAPFPSIWTPTTSPSVPTIAAPPAVTTRAASVMIWGRTLDSANPYYINGDNGAQGSVSRAEPAAWNAYYNASTGVLKLNGLNVTNSTATTGSDIVVVYGIYADGSVAIELAGDSRVSAGVGVATVSQAIYVTGDLTLRGTGMLAARTGMAQARSCGVFVIGALTVSGGALTATAGMAQESYGLCIMGDTGVSGGAVSGGSGATAGNSFGMCTYGTLTVSGDGEVTGTGNDGYSSRGVFSATGLTVSDSGAVSGTGGRALGDPGYSCTSIGVQSGAALTVSGNGRITATGGEASGFQGCSYGAYANGAFTVSDGTLTATANTAYAGSFGVYTEGALTISSGTLTATADTANSVSYGVRASGALTASGGTLAATAGTTPTGNSTGLCIIGGISVTGGTVSGTGKAAVYDSLGVYGGGTLTVSGGGKLTGTGDTGVTSYGVLSLGALTVSDSGEITGTSGVAGYATEEPWVASIGVRSGAALTVSGGTLAAKCAAPQSLGSKNYCYGVFSDPLKVSGGRLTAETATPSHANMNALSVPPEMLCASYYWRTAIVDDYTQYTQGGSNPYMHAAMQTYVDIRESLPTLPRITVSVPAFGEGQAPQNERITVEHDAGFNATNNFLNASLGSTTLDLGTVGQAGSHGSVEDGSIIIRLKKTYLDTLPTGTYLLTVNLKGPGYTGRSVSVHIRVDPPSLSPAASADIPDTGDTASVALWACAAILAAGALLAEKTVRRRGKRKIENG